MNQWEKLQGILINCSLLAVVVMGAVWVYKNADGSSGFSSAEMAKYHSYYEDCLDQKGGRPRRKGKVLLLVEPSLEDVSNALQVHPQHHMLPESIRATPGDVGTLAVVAKGRTSVGSYTHGAQAYQVTTYIKLIDAKTGKFIGVKSLEGSAPPDKIKYKVMSKEAHVVEGKAAPVLEAVISLRS